MIYYNDHNIMTLEVTMKQSINLTIMRVKSVCLSVCQPPLAPSLLHGRKP